MSGSDSGEGGGGGGIKTVLLVVVAIVAGFWAIKLTAWLLKTALLVGAVGVVGYLGYSWLSGKLGSEASKPKELTAEPGETRLQSDSASADIDEALRELKELERTRGE